MASIQLKDLVPGKNYKVKVRAKYKGEDPGPWSKILNFKAPIKSKDDNDDTLNSKYGIVVGSKKNPKRGYIISSTFNGQITLKNGLVIDDNKNNTNIGTQGWAIDHKGNSIFNNIVARGQLIIDLNNNQGRMYFGENIPAFGTEKADGIKLDTYNYWFRTKSIADKRPSWRVGDADSFVSYNPDSSSADGKLIVSGQIQAGLGTQNQVLLGANVGGSGIGGIKIDGSNFWYDSDKVAANAIFFKVSGADETAITVNKAGRVVINSDHSGGRIKGRLSVRLGEGDASDKFIIGQNVPSLSGLTGDEFDGIKLDTNNYWVLSNTAKKAYLRVGTSTKNLSFDGATGLLKLTGGDITLTGGGTFKTADSNTRVEMTSNGIFGYKGTATDPIFYIRASDGQALFEGETNPTGGTVKGKLTIQGTTYAFGKDVISTKDGLYLNANNYWTLSQTGATAEFKVGGASRYVAWDGGSLNISGTLVGADGTFSGGITANSFQTAVGTNSNFIRMSNVDGTAKSDLLEFVYVTTSLSKTARSSSSPIRPARMYLRVGSSPTTEQTLSIEGYDPGGTNGSPPEIDLMTTSASTSSILMSATNYNISTYGGLGTVQISGNTNITGTFTVNGSAVGGGSGGYINATDGTTSNKITYGGSPPGTGRTNGDIHFVL